MLTRIKTASLVGMSGYVVTVEVDVHKGMPDFNVVGLADTTIKESFRRIRPAIINSGFEFPSQKVTVNLVPAGKRKEGSHFDLPIALGAIFCCEEYLDINDTAFFGELSLDGKINHIKGALPLAMAVRAQGIKKIVVPMSNAREVAILKDIEIIPMETLNQAALYVMNPQEFDSYTEELKPCNDFNENLDFAQVIGHESIKRALVVAAAGQHGVLLMGSPGSGKTMMAKRMPSILPDLTYEEALEITGIYSVAGLLGEDKPIIDRRPFRNPHHTISAVGLTGGGSGKIRPGELSLAHGGVLFLDELGEFDNRTIDAMRQPLEEGVVRINRNTEELVFPSRTLVVVASNPCKCGNLWDTNKVCTCNQRQLEAHERKLTGPFADRIDMHIKVAGVPAKSVMEDGHWESSESMRAQVMACRRIQDQRYEGLPYRTNGDLDEKGIKAFCQLDKEGSELLNRAYESMHMNMRAYSKVLKISRTIADLEGSESIDSSHIAEAIMYRVKG